MQPAESCPASSRKIGAYHRHIQASDINTMQALKSPVASVPQGSARRALRPSRAACLVPRAASEPQPQVDRRQALATGLAAALAAAGWDGAAPQVSNASLLLGKAVVWTCTWPLSAGAC